MESASERGYDKTKKISISERTKRVMLAEAVENRIFQLQDDLDALLMIGETDQEAAKGDGTVPASSSAAAVPEDAESVRAKCVDIAKEIKIAQRQYRELVSGEPSVMLSALESLNRSTTQTTGKGRNDDGDDYGRSGEGAFQ